MLDGRLTEPHLGEKMIIKESGSTRKHLNFFYLFGDKETGLTKAFAYVLSVNRLVMFSFLKELGINISNTDNNFSNIEISIERKREEGRTDIEILYKNKFHVIIEAKVGSNKVLQQKTQYLTSFENVSEKVLCFISQINEFRKIESSDIKVKNLNWINIDSFLDEKKYLDDVIVRNFQLYLRRFFKMKAQKEILVQDLGNENDMKIYKDYDVYRQAVIFGSPLYFAPYFTRASNQSEGEGIGYISKVLGIISCKTKEIPAFREELLNFSDNDSSKVNKWLAGISLFEDNEEHTFFFLDEKVRLPQNLLKDGTREKGRGKDWIAAMIPPNRCVTFEEFIKHMNA